MAMGEPIHSERELAISRSKSNSQSHHRINRSHRTYSFTFLPFRVNISRSLIPSDFKNFKFGSDRRSGSVLVTLSVATQDFDLSCTAR